MVRCIVHDPGPADYDTRHLKGDWVPPIEQLEREMSRHLASLIGPHTHFWRRVHQRLDPYCGECEENYQVRRQALGIEDILLEEDHHCKLIQQECTCPPDSPNRFYFLQELRYVHRETS